MQTGMKELKLKYYILILLFSFGTFSINCREKDQYDLNPQNKFILANPSHLNNLYEEIMVGGKQMAIIHIYSDYPDYTWVEAKGEGIACVDDVARSTIFYSKYYKITHEKIYLRKVKLLTEFILYMQAENGYFNNFIENGYSINKTYKTSLAQPDWWSWRAVWALSETYKLFSKNDAAFANRIYQSMGKLFSALEKNLPMEKRIKNIDGFERPAWLMFETGADQTSILILALVNYLEIKKDPVLLGYLKDLCDGIILMQVGDKDNFPYYAFMSWENLWHAYGNSQSYALLKAYELTHDEKYKIKALLEINYFYPYLIKENFINYFTIKNDKGKIILDERKQFSQIAYGIRPMIFASLEAAKITGNKSYAEFAGKIDLWFFGKNIAEKEMYDSKSGICYDGINSEKDVNKNSGAESTIETLLSISAVEQNKNAFSIVKNFMEKK
jgi:hypothetical protein